MPILQYDISVVGVDVVERALATIEKRFTTHTRTMTREAMRATQATPELRAAGRNVGGGAGGAQAAAEKMAVRALAAEQKKAVQAVYREEMKNQQSLLRMQKERWRDELREAKKAITERAREEKRAAKEAEHEWRARVVGHVGKLGMVGSASMSVGKAALAATGLAGGGLIASRLAPALDLEQRQRQVIINARDAGAADPISYKSVRSTVNSVATATGIGQGDLTGALETYTARTGRLKEATENLKVFATVASATGSSVESVAATAVDLSEKFDIKNVKEMSDALAVLTFQGKKGAFELRDMANTFPALSAAAARVGMKGVGGMKTLGGLAQLARTTAASGDVASTNLQAMLSQIIGKAGELGKGHLTGGNKVDVYADKQHQHLRDIPTVLADIISASRGNLTSMKNIFEQEGSRAASPLVMAYSKAYQGTTGTDAEKNAAGRAAILATINDASNAIGTYKDVQKDAADTQQSTAIQLQKVMNELTGEVQRGLLPELEALLPTMRKMVPELVSLLGAFTKVVGFLTHNPFAGVAMIIAAKVYKDIAAARIGNAARSAIEVMLGAHPSGGGAVGAAASAAGALTGGGGGYKQSTIAKIASYAKYVPIAGELGAAVGAGLGAAAVSSMDKTHDPFMAALQADTERAKGEMSNEEMATKKTELEGMRSQLQQNAPTLFDRATAFVASGGKESAEGERQKALDALTKSIENLKKTIDYNNEVAQIDQNIANINRGNSPSPVK